MTAAGDVPLTVVIPAYQPPPGALERLLEALSEQAGAAGLADQAGAAGAPSTPLPVVVSDDASPEPLDHRVGRLRLPGLDVRVVRSPDNGGPGAARNHGLTQVTTAWVAFLDADTVPGPGWLAILLAVAAEPDGPAGPDWVSGRLEIPGADRPSPFTHATELLGPEVTLGGNIAFRTDGLRQAGGFDERYYDRRRRLHFREDAALHFTLTGAGRRLAWRSDLVALHPPLPRSYRAPLRLARRYYFDPLLDREHHDAFARLNAGRTVGPISLRRARHLAAAGHTAACAALLAGVLTRNRRLRRVGWAGLAVTWPANVAALAWRRRVAPAEVPALLAVGGLTPLVYWWHHTRGEITFRHRPKY